MPVSSFVKSFSTNKDKEKEGIWFEFAQEEEDEGKPVRFKIRRTGTANTKYLKKVEKLTRPYRGMRQMNPTLTLNLARKAYIETCIVAWENVDLGKGALPFNADNLKLFMDTLPDALDLLMTVSNDQSYFQDDVEDDVKNSPSA